MTDGHADAHAHEGGHASISFYIRIGAVLAVVTGVEVAVFYLPRLEAVATPLLVVLSTAKIILVVMFFMHLKFEGNWKYVLLAPTTILAIGLPMALMPDIGVSYYEPLAPQTGDWGPEMQDYKAHHAEHMEHANEDSGEPQHAEPEHQGAAEPGADTPADAETQG